MEGGQPMPSDGPSESPGRFEVHIDADECVSAGRCVGAAPGFFVFDDDELATVHLTGPRPVDDVLLRIARQCPSGAIRLRVDGVDVDV